MSDTLQEEIFRFLHIQFSPDLVQRILDELGQREGLDLGEYSEEELEEVAIRVSDGSIRLRTDITRGLLRLQAGGDDWSVSLFDG